MASSLWLRRSSFAPSVSSSLRVNPGVLWRRCRRFHGFPLLAASLLLWSPTAMPRSLSSALDRRDRLRQPPSDGSLVLVPPPPAQSVAHRHLVARVQRRLDIRVVRRMPALHRPHHSRRARRSDRRRGRSAETFGSKSAFRNIWHVFSAVEPDASHVTYKHLRYKLCSAGTSTLTLE